MRFPAYAIAILHIAIPVSVAVGEDGNQEQELEEKMVNQHRALALKSRNAGKMTEITVIAKTNDPVQVNYKLAVAGGSSTRHSGSTRLTSGPEQILSRVTIPQKDRWCATLDVTQGDGLSYRLQDGFC